jgi:hypothetical protein
MRTKGPFWHGLIGSTKVGTRLVTERNSGIKRTGSAVICSMAGSVGTV